MTTEIIEHLQKWPDSTLHETRVAELSHHRDVAVLPAVGVLEKLQRRRTFASNSLVRGEGLQAWRAADQWVVQQILQSRGVSFSALAHLQKLVASGQRGRGLREHPVYSGDEEYLPLAGLDAALALLNQWEQKSVDSDFDQLSLAFKWYEWIVTVHPFVNANGRTARLAGDWVLMSHGWLPMSYTSPIQSHVAMTLGGPKRHVDRSFAGFLNAIAHSYLLVRQNLARELHGEECRGMR